MKPSAIVSDLFLLIWTATAATLLACSDDGTATGDAAACTCPAAEPPLPGRIVQRNRTVQIAANGGGQGEAPCLGGEILLGGGCLLDAIPNAQITLFEAGITDTYFRCGWLSQSPQAYTGTASVICLLPP